MRGRVRARARSWRGRLSRIVLGLAACGAVGGCAHGPARAVRGDPFGHAVDPAALDGALANVSAGCRAPLRSAFEQGVRPNGCTDERREVGRALAKQTAREFGFVDQRRVDLRGVSLVVDRAWACREWPLRAPKYAVLTRPEIQDAGCRLARYSGPIEVTAFEADGTSYPGIIQLHANEGVVRLAFAEADAVLRAHGLQGLDAFEQLHIGRGGWAGTVHLRRLREFRAIWHFVWVVRGRGAPGLFAAAHPEHERVKDARALAVEAALGRQERDYLAVARDEMSARRFLERYVWSPYRRSVAAMAGAPPVPRPEVDVQVEVESGSPPEASIADSAGALAR